MRANSTRPPTASEAMAVSGPLAGATALPKAEMTAGVGAAHEIAANGDGADARACGKFSAEERTAHRDRVDRAGHIHFRVAHVGRDDEFAELPGDRTHE